MQKKKKKKEEEIIGEGLKSIISNSHKIQEYLCHKLCFQFLYLPYDVAIAFADGKLDKSSSNYRGFRIKYKNKLVTTYF